MGKAMEEKFSMAFKYKFNIFILTYPELHVTGDHIGEGISTTLPFSYTLLLSSTVGNVRKAPGLLSTSGLHHHSCSSPH